MAERLCLSGWCFKDDSRLRLERPAWPQIEKEAGAGKPEAYRHVLRHSRKGRRRNGKAERSAHQAAKPHWRSDHFPFAIHDHDSWLQADALEEVCEARV